jgi:DNA-binding MurR/RpiR family transcriptional regulator
MPERIDTRIARCHDRLSPQERKAADTLLEHLDDLGTYRAAELATLAGVSKATMSRLFRSLGFADFDEVREHLRTLRGNGEPRRVDGPPNLAAHADAEGEAIRRCLEQPELATAITALADAGKVLVAGWRNSYPVALHLRQQLIQARPAVTLAPLPGQVVGEELADLRTGDAVVAIGFRRRPSGFGDFVAAASATGATTIVIADPGAAVHFTHGTVALQCAVHAGLAFDSYAAAMSLVSVLADGVLFARGRTGRSRVSGISATYDRLAELE